MKIISASQGYPPPGRALRNLVGRSLVVLYTCGEMRTLFDTLQALLCLVGDVGNLDKDVLKVYLDANNAKEPHFHVLETSWMYLGPRYIYIFIL